ncbi:MAG: hypothetical protein JOZ75_01895 [Candidatus Dormibacteraeota bacterium]|nr:hypothetical protein [Candidatus Dormibacteraeota bacterium]
MRLAAPDVPPDNREMPGDVAAYRRLYEMILGYRVSQVLRVAAILGIADEIADGRATASAIAGVAGVDSLLLHRLLRTLAALGVLSDLGDGSFATTDLGELLRSATAGSLRDMAVANGEPGWWAAWEKLPRAVRGDGVAFEIANGHNWWQEMDASPGLATLFNNSMIATAERLVPQLVEALEIAGARHIVDVGGGNGALLAGILQAAPRARGTVFDRATGLAGAGEYLTHHGVADRCAIVEGDFFESVPSGGDIYVLSRILHDWPDEQAAAILRSCRRAMTADTTLVVIDVVLPARAVDDAESHLAVLFDMHMFVLFGAQERTDSEFRRLLGDAGFRVDRVLPTLPTATLVATAI